MKFKKIPLMVLATSLFLGGGMILNHSINNDNVAVARAELDTSTGITFTEASEGVQVTKSWDFSTVTSTMEFKTNGTVTTGGLLIKDKGYKTQLKSGILSANWKDNQMPLVAFPVEIGAEGTVKVVNTSNQSKRFSNINGDTTTNQSLHTSGKTHNFTAADLTVVDGITYITVGFDGGEAKVSSIVVSYKTGTKYDVTFMDGEGQYGETSSILEGTTIDAPTAPADKLGSKFVGWSTDGVTPVTFPYTITAATTFYALWETVATYTVTYDVQGGSVVDSETLNEGTTATRPTDPTKDNAVFVEWLLNGVTYDFATPVTSSITLTASWDEGFYASGVSIDQESFTWNPNEEVVLSATPTGDHNITEYNYEWVSSNPEVVTIADGVLTYVGKGISNISVKAYPGTEHEVVSEPIEVTVTRDLMVAPNAHEVVNFSNIFAGITSTTVLTEEVGKQYGFVTVGDGTDIQYVLGATGNNAGRNNKLMIGAGSSYAFEFSTKQAGTLTIVGVGASGRTLSLAQDVDGTYNTLETKEFGTQAADVTLTYTIPEAGTYRLIASNNLYFGSITFDGNGGNAYYNTAITAGYQKSVSGTSLRILGKVEIETLAILDYVSLEYRIVPTGVDAGEFTSVILYDLYEKIVGPEEVVYADGEGVSAFYIHEIEIPAEFTGVVEFKATATSSINDTVLATTQQSVIY